MNSSPDGFTLVEMLVVLVLLGLLAGLATLSPAAGRLSFIERETGAPSIAAARRQAILHGQPVTIVHHDSARGAAAITAFPDGRLLGHPRYDPMTGRRDATR